MVRTGHKVQLAVSRVRPVAPVIALLCEAEHLNPFEKHSPTTAKILP